MESWRTPTRICLLWPLRRWKAPPSVTFFSITAVENGVCNFFDREVFGVHGAIFLWLLEVEPIKRCLTQNHLHPLMLWGWAILDKSTHLAKVVVASQWRDLDGLFKANHRTCSSVFPSHPQFDSSIIVHPVTKESRIYSRSTANCVACSVAKSCISLGWQTHGAQCASKVMGMKNHAKGIWRYGLRN